MLQHFLAVSHPDWLGSGADMADFWPGAGWSGLNVAQAWRIENPGLWGSYTAARQKLMDCGLTMPPVLTSSNLKRATDQCPAELQAGVNEMYLLHACPPHVLLNIIHQGFNERFAGSNAGAAFGEGNYFGDDAGKPDQYAVRDEGMRYDGDYTYVSSRGRECNYPRESLRALHSLLYGTCPHPRDVFYVLVCRVMLGHQVRTADGLTNLDGAGESPFALGGKSKRELAAIPGTMPPQPYHSLFAEACPDGPTRGGCRHTPKHWVCRYNEYISFHGEYVYPEYLVAYHRS